jgi:hypothetical protein
MDGLSLTSRLLVAAVSALLLVGGAVGYAVSARDHTDVVRSAALVTISPGPRLLVVTDRHLATVAADDPSGPKTVAALECVRAYAAGGRGVCLHQDTAWSYSLKTLDSSLKEQESFRIGGLPNRARVSASGRMVSWTSFISGESYNKGGFSTRTGILDTATGERATSLESFAIIRDGAPYRAIDVNFWGVTFAADDNRFYATMATDGRRYLVRGDFAARTVRTLTTNVECPSLSPDGKRIAFKRAIGDNPVNGWRISVLDLATMNVTPLAETRSIDDQPAWLDDATVAYTVRDSSGAPSVWSTRADGRGEPRLLVPAAESPAALDK